MAVTYFIKLIERNLEISTLLHNITYERLIKIKLHRIIVNKNYKIIVSIIGYIKLNMKKIITFFIKKIMVNIPISDLIFIKFLKIKILNPIIKIILAVKIEEDMQNILSYKNYWSEKISIKWQIYNKYFFSEERLKNLRKIEIIISLFSDNLRFFEIGCGYPLYLKSEILKDKIKNYYGYDINPFINTFFSIKNVQSSLPITPKYDVILIIGGVLKYFREEELIRIFKVIEEHPAVQFIWVNYRGDDFPKLPNLFSKDETEIWQA